MSQTSATSSFSSQTSQSGTTSSSQTLSSSSTSTPTSSSATTTDTATPTTSSSTTSQTTDSSASSSRSASVIVVTLTSSQSDAGSTQAPVVVTQFSTVSFTQSASRTSSSTSTNTPIATSISQSQQAKSGLGTGGTIAVAVAVPVGVILLLGILGILYWRRRKRRNNELAQRKEEAEEYNYNPNDYNPDSSTMPSGALAAGAAAGALPYRGWQPTASHPTPIQEQSYLVGGAAPLHSDLDRRTSGGLSNSASANELPTLPVIDAGDVDSLRSYPSQDKRLSGVRQDPSVRNQISPGNGSPPLSALEPELLHRADSDASHYGEIDPPAPRSQVHSAPYPVGNMSTMMPPLQRGSERTPNVHSQDDAEEARRYSYTNF